MFAPRRPQGGSVTVKESDAASLVSHPGFDKDHVTVFYLHGYSENRSSESIAVVSEGECVRWVVSRGTTPRLSLIEFYRTRKS